MWKKVLIAAAGLAVLAVLAVAGVAATRPDRFRVERSLAMAAPPAGVYARIADFRAWEGWSPWARLDPSMKVTYGGAAAGPGATYAWAGDDRVGSGRMTITAAEPPARIAIRLEFLEPFEETAETVFALAPEGSGTRVTWTMAGESSFVGKVMGLFMDMDQMIGKDFEKGLAQLARASSDAPTPAPTGAPGGG
jgi:uncharacterized protein YndB with AHSA1/START domain